MQTTSDLPKTMPAPSVGSGDLLVCEGACKRDGGCQGTVRKVEVFNSNGSWGKYCYCETAIAIDRKNGYEIREAD